MSEEVWIGMVWGLVGSALLVIGSGAFVHLARSLSSSGEPVLRTSLVPAADPATLAVMLVLGTLVVGTLALGRR
ncbi:hypothetical protein [Natronorarus salvus]|uniref:hypothetical protein n=1 Tax=Natronorarus salvus TaxID=3117733 RepID=UPI002F26A719